MERRELPHDVLTHGILPRLPIKQLLRFKSVSKQWYSTISSPQFGHTHFKFQHPSHAESLLIRSNTRYDLLSYENDNMKLVKIEVDFDHGKEKLVLVGSCNGLVCFGSSSGCLFIIWNPITREFRKYLDSEICKFVNIGWMVTWGFGYVSAIDDYNIVRICKEIVSQSIRVHVFSTKFDKWTRIDEDPSHDFSGLIIAERLHRPGVLVDETLYWMGGVPPVFEGLQRKIMSFNLSLGLFENFPHLDVSTPSSWVNECFDEFLCVVKGRLSKYGRFVRSGDGVIRILKHPEEDEQILLARDLIGSACKNLIGFTKCDKLFKQYYDKHEPHLGIIDPSSNPMRHTTLMTLHKWSKTEIINYSPSLISPNALKNVPMNSYP